MNRLNWFFLLIVTILLIPAEKATAKKKTEKCDREIWCEVMYRMAAPVLSNMSEGALKQNMLVELSPTWDGRNKDVTYMECFGRLMAGLAPWLSLPDDNTTEGTHRKQLREWALKSYVNAVDPKSPDYLLWRQEGQTLVDAPISPKVFYEAMMLYGHRWIASLNNVTSMNSLNSDELIRHIATGYCSVQLSNRFLRKAAHPATPTVSVLPYGR